MFANRNPQQPLIKVASPSTRTTVAIHIEQTPDGQNINDEHDVCMKACIDSFNMGGGFKFQAQHDD